MIDTRIITASEAATDAAGFALAGLLEPNDVLLLSGDLGAGKTQLSKGIARGLGVKEPVTSPTFNIMLVHEGSSLTLYHLDLYRMDRADQLDEIGYFEALESGGVAVVEWGDRFPETAPAEHLALVMHVTGDETRAIELVPAGDRGRSLASAWLNACATLAGVRVDGGSA